MNDGEIIITKVLYKDRKKEEKKKKRDIFLLLIIILILGSCCVAPTHPMFNKCFTLNPYVLNYE